MSQGVVHSSHGDLIIDMASGNLIAVEEDEAAPGELIDIERFDLDEYFKAYPNESRDVIADFDILDIGFWRKDGVYIPAVEDFRADIASQLAIHGGDLQGLVIPGAVASMLKGGAQ